MILQYCSDLHLEFPANRHWLKENSLEPVGDILVIAGDTHYLGRDYQKLPIWKELAKQFEEVYVLPGNHEYYGGYDLSNHSGEVKQPLRRNVWLVNNTVINKPDVQLIFTTLWSKIEQHVAPVLLGMNDFKRIRYQGKVIGIDHYNQLHQNARTFLTHALTENSNKKQSDRRAVVISHHLPSERCNVDEYKGSLLNEAFCIDMTTWIEESAIDAWIYGHSHRNKTVFTIGKTRMLTNQLGYVQYGEHNTFERNAWFEM